MSEKLSTRVEVIELLLKLPLRGAKRLPDGATSKQLDSAEDSLGYELPTEYRDWLSISNGPPVVPGGMVGIGKKVRANDILGLFAIYPEWRDKRYLPITGDGLGNDFILAIGDEFGGWRPVLFVETQAGLTSPSYIVASDLWHFLKAFFLSELGDEWWPFDPERTTHSDPDIMKVPNVTLPWDCQNRDPSALSAN